MTLGFNNFFKLDSSQYKAYLKTKTDEELKTQEIKRLRGETANCYTAGVGVAGAIPSLGATLVLSGVALRKRRVCERKHEMIQEELVSRGIPLHETELKDIMIPMIAGIVGTFVTLGLDIGITDAIGTQVPVNVDGSLQTHPMSNVEQLRSFVSHPAAAAAGAQQGLLNQPIELVHELSNHMEETLDMNGAHNASEHFVGMTGNAAEVAGFAQGTNSAELMEKTAGAHLASQAWTLVADAIGSKKSLKNRERK